MASSGNKVQAFCSRNGANRYYLKMKWWQTAKNVNTNQSTLKIAVYLGSYGNGYGMNSSATKSGYVTVAGTKYNFSKAGLSLSSGGEILLYQKTDVKINHADNGTASFSMTAYFNPAVTISGSSSGSVTIPSTTYTLDTIPRASSISSAGGWTAGNNTTVSISRKSSSYNHKVQIYSGSTKIAERTGVGTSCTFSFSSAENQSIFAALGTSASKTMQVRVLTMSGSTQIGSTATKDVTVSNAASSTTTFTSSANIGGTISGTITSKNKLFTHRIRLLQSNKSTAISTWLSNSTTSTAKAWSYTLPTSMYALTPNSNSYTCYVEITTYWNGTSQTVGTTPTRYGTITAKVASSNPTFAPSSNFSYLDYDTTTTGVTGNNQYLIQGYSKLRVTLAAAGLATGKNSATIKEYHCSFGNNTKKATHTSGTACTFDFGTISASTNQTMTIKAIDSRGNSTTVSKTVYVLPYSKPKVIVTAGRKDGFTTTVNVSVKGTYSKLTVGSTDKNTINTVTHSMRVDSGTQPSQTKFSTITASKGNYSTNTNAYTLALTSVGRVRIGVQDKLATVTVDVEISTGLPLFYVDSSMGSASFNKLPSYRSTLEMGLKLDTAKNQYWGGGKADYGLNLQNSDIVHINSLVFGDLANNLGEGLRFPNTTMNWTTDYGHQNPTVAENGQTGTALKNVYGDYTVVYFRNQEMWVDGAKFLKFNNVEYGSNANWTQHYLSGYCNGYVLQCQDIDPAESKKDWGFILTDTSRNYQFHADPNEMMWTVKNDAGKRIYSPNYLQASSHNIQAMSVDGNNTSLGVLKFTSDSTPKAYLQCLPVYERTTTSSANVLVHTNGTFYRSTSSAKAKLDIVPAFDSLEEYKKILNIEPVKWFDKHACEVNAEIMTAELTGEEVDFAEQPNLNRVYGCVAEQLEEVGLNCLVDYDSTNENIAGVAYDRIPIMYIPLIKDLYNQVDELKAEIQTLKGETGK